MGNSIIHSGSHEDNELKQKLLELRRLEKEIAETEERFQSLQARLEEFRLVYDSIITLRQSELQQIEEQIAQALLSQNSHAQSNEIKNIYRRLAKLIHPDLASEPGDIEMRKELMIIANNALDNGDIETLKQMLSEIQMTDDLRMSGLTSSRLELIKLQISKSRRRLAQISVDLSRASQSELFKTMTLHNDAKRNGQDYLSELADQLDMKIDLARQRLSKIISRDV